VLAETPHVAAIVSQFLQPVLSQFTVHRRYFLSLMLHIEAYFCQMNSKVEVEMPKTEVQSEVVGCLKTAQNSSQKEIVDQFAEFSDNCSFDGGLNYEESLEQK
jgi:hypothetical protein